MAGYCLSHFEGFEFQIELGFRFCGRRVNRFQIFGDFSSLLLVDVLERVAHQMHHTELNSCVRHPTASMASGSPVRPSTQAIKQSAHPPIA